MAGTVKNSSIDLSVVIPTHNPDRQRLNRTLTALAKQTLGPLSVEYVVVDNGSIPRLSEDIFNRLGSVNFKIVVEPNLGLTKARLQGIKSSSGRLVIFCDDDNVLAPGYISSTIRNFNLHSHVGIAGGRSIPVFDLAVPAWYRDGMAPIGCQDFGNEPVVFESDDYHQKKTYPTAAPIGAGMVFRREAIQRWLDTAETSEISDRKGNDLSSAGDCDIVLHVLDAGWSVAYWPDLRLEHLIPASRTCKEYLAKVSRCAFRDFIKVLDLHGIQPWPAISPMTLPLRTLKAWLRYRPWRSPNAFIEFHSTVGQYEGRASLPRKKNVR